MNSQTDTQIETAHVYVFKSVLAVFQRIVLLAAGSHGVDGIQCANSRPIRLSAQLQHTEDKNIQREELALPPGSKAYYDIVRTGVCNAYLAASVVGSSLVDTSLTGGMSMVSAELSPESGRWSVGVPTFYVLNFCANASIEASLRVRCLFSGRRGLEAIV